MKPNPESLAAYTQVQPTKQETCSRIMAFAIHRGLFGFTADELAFEWGCSHNHVAPRVCEMKDEGQLVLTDRCRPTRAGTLARILVARKFAEPTTPAKESLFTEDELKALARWEYPG